jgi:hypothetical protein
MKLRLIALLQILKQGVPKFGCRLHPRAGIALDHSRVVDFTLVVAEPDPEGKINCRPLGRDHEPVQPTGYELDHSAFSFRMRLR